MNVNNILNVVTKIRLSFHQTWILAFVIIMAILVTRFPEYYSLTDRMVLGFVASLLFFLAMTIRQLAINLTSYFRGIPLKGVVLYPFGGAHQIVKEKSSPILESLLAVVGLLCSFIIVVAFYAIYVGLVVAGDVMFAWMIQWLAYISTILFVFQLVPGFPLEGGRLLQAILWKITGNYDRAVRTPILIGQATGMVFCAGGIGLLISRQWFAGIMVLFLGGTLYLAARRKSGQTYFFKSLEGITVQQLMTREFPVITRHHTLEQLVKEYILTTGQRQFVVFDEDKLHGILTVDGMKTVPRKNWEGTPASYIMTPLSQQTTAYVGQYASELLERMNTYGISHIPVMDGNKVVGLVARDAIIRYYKTRNELKFGKYLT